MTRRYRQLSQKNHADLTIKDMVYLNACECIYYGYGYQHLNKCGLSDFVCKMVWRDAFQDMAEEQ